MFERAKDKWAAQTRDSKRVIIAIVVLSLIASVVVIATVSKSASLKSPKSEPVWENIRLPDFIRPISYDVKLKINMTGEFFTGVEDVFVNITKATSVILIHTSSAESFDKVANKTAKEMKVESFKIVQYSMESKKEGSDIKVKHAYAWSQNDFFVMKLKSTIEQGIYKLTFTWRSRLVRGLDGIYISSYKENGIEKKMLASQMEPLAARKVMPCFDEPDFKAKFTMEITSEDSYGLVLWNMPQIGDAVPVKGGEKWSTRKFKESVPMSTYLLAFVVADFKCTDILETGKGVKVRTCGRSEAIIDKKSGDYSNKINKVIIERYEEFYGENFPLPKIDSVAIPDFSAGAMENWGLILYRETALLYDPNYDTLNNKARVNTVVSHELAHQWFGNLVTMKWWNDLWLNEGFASYVEWLGTDASQPDWNYLDFQTYSDRSRAFGIDAYSSSRPTSIGVEKPADITAQFDSISYAKGSALLVQAKMFMGGKPSKDFEKSIQNYVKRYKFSNTVQDDLYREMSKVYAAKDDTDKYADKSVNISDVMNTWTLQMNFPVVSVQQYDEGHVILSSKRFLISESGLEGDKRSPYGYQWFVPVEYTIDNNDKEFKWIKPHSKLLVPFNFTNNSYMHINKESAGYYITDYSHDLFGRLLKQLKTDTSNFTISERQGLLYETFTLVSGGYKPMNMALELLKAILDGEKSLVPLREISRQLSRVLIHIREDDALAKNWKAKWKPRMEMLFKVHGAEYFKTDKTKETVLPLGDVNFQKRLLITFAVSLGCSYGVQDCVDAAKVKFTAYKSDAKANPLPSDFRGTVLNTAMSVDTVTEEEWDFLWSQYQESDSQSEKQTMYYALGLIQKESVLKKFSEMCLNESLVRSSDALYIMGRSISQTYLGAKVSLDFMLNKWDYISKDFTNGLFAVDSYISGVLSKFANQPTLERIEKFFSTKERQESLGAGLASYKSSIQSIKSNIGWLEKHLESVKKFVG